jgi:hypothetical protein
MSSGNGRPRLNFNSICSASTKHSAQPSQIRSSKWLSLQRKTAISVQTGQKSAYSERTVSRAMAADVSVVVSIPESIPCILAFPPNLLPPTSLKAPLSAKTHFGTPLLEIIRRQGTSISACAIHHIGLELVRSYLTNFLLQYSIVSADNVAPFGIVSRSEYSPRRIHR